MNRESYSSAPKFSLTGGLTVTKENGAQEVYTIIGENGVVITMNESGMAISGTITKAVEENIETFEINCTILEEESNKTLECNITKTISETEQDVYKITASLVYDNVGNIATFTYQVLKNEEDITPSPDSDSIITRILSEVGNINALMPVLMGYDIEGVEFAYINAQKLEKDGFGSILVESQTIDDDTNKYNVKWNIDKYMDFVGNEHEITGEWEFTESFFESENQMGYKVDKDSFVYTSPLRIDDKEYSSERVLGDYFNNSIINNSTRIH